MTALKVLTEKSTLKTIDLKSGSWTRSDLCMGVNSSCAAAVTPYWSSVDLVWVNHIFVFGHHKAWSDQSIAISATDNNVINKSFYQYFIN